MDAKATTLIQEIQAAFGDRALSPDDPIFIAESAELDMPSLRSTLRRYTWGKLPHGVVVDNPIALAFMTPAAFAHFLPSFMVISVALYYDADTLAGDVITCLTPPDGATDLRIDSTQTVPPELSSSLLEEAQSALQAGVNKVSELFRVRVEQLTAPQLEAVREFLWYMLEAHGEDFPVAGPQQALERYWDTECD